MTEVKVWMSWENTITNSNVHYPPCVTYKTKGQLSINTLKLQQMISRKLSHKLFRTCDRINNSTRNGFLAHKWHVNVPWGEEEGREGQVRGDGGGNEAVAMMDHLSSETAGPDLVPGVVAHMRIKHGGEHQVLRQSRTRAPFYFRNNFDTSSDTKH